ncbi:hypothetical protein HDU96_005703 [Phlyctochytrium bullatum]|nr:hypothetical protein HDU96_005703 [Phlyctochytrium bullatum]
MTSFTLAVRPALLRRQLLRRIPLHQSRLDVGSASFLPTFSTGPHRGLNQAPDALRFSTIAGGLIAGIPLLSSPLCARAACLHGTCGLLDRQMLQTDVPMPILRSRSFNTSTQNLAPPVDPATNSSPQAAAAAAQAAGIPASQIKPESPVEQVIRDLKEEEKLQQQQQDATAPSAPSGTAPVEAPTPVSKPVETAAAPAAAPIPTPEVPSTSTATASTSAVAQPAPAAVEEHAPKKSLWERIKHEAMHYWHGTKLLGAEAKISSRLVKKLLNGQSLTRRENRQLRRTIADLARLVPFLVIVLIPFLELALPFLLYLFPNMLPSTFESKFQEEEKKKKLLKVRLEMARFLQDTVEDIAVTGSARAAAAKEFSDFFKKYRASGVQAPTEETLKIAKKFENELTLNSLSRPQLVSMARYMNINAFGTDAFLRHQIDQRLKYLKADDLLIQKEGVDSLSLQELQQVCQSRGIRTIGVSPARLRSELNQWLELHLVHKVPSSLLILSRAFTISEKIPSSQDEALKGSAEALQATLSSLPDQVVSEAQLKVSETAGVATYQQKLNVLQQQEELIADELEQEAEHAETKAPVKEKAAPAATSTAAGAKPAEPPTDAAKEVEEEEEHISEAQLKQLGDAIKTMTSDSALQDVKALLEDLKEERKEYIEDIDELKALTQKELPKATESVSSRVDKMISKIEKELEKYDSEIGSRLNLIRPDEEGRLTVKDLEDALRVIRDNPGDERIRKIVKRLDTDGDGSVSMAEILAMASETEKEVMDPNQAAPADATQERSDVTPAAVLPDPNASEPRTLSETHNPSSASDTVATPQPAEHAEISLALVPSSTPAETVVAQPRSLASTLLARGNPFTPITKRKLNQVLSAFDVAVAEKDDAIRVSDSGFMARLGTQRACPMTTAEDVTDMVFSSRLFPRLNCRPASLHESTWFAKPDELSPVACARSGWSNTGPDRLVCMTPCNPDADKENGGIRRGEKKHSKETEPGGCGAILVISMSGFDFVNDSESTALVTSKYVSQLKDMHAPTCPWKLRVVEDSVYRFPITSSAVAIRSTQKRLNRLAEGLESVPQITGVQLATSSHPEHHIVIDPSLRVELGNRTNDDLSILLTLSLYGWEPSRTPILGRPEAQPGPALYLKCFLCHRMVPARSSPAEGAASKRRRLTSGDDADESEEGLHGEVGGLVSGVEDADGFNPKDEHRWYCPWICPQSDGVKKGKSGYEINLEALIKGHQKQQGITPDVGGNATDFNIVKTHQFLKQYGF